MQHGMARCQGGSRHFHSYHMSGFDWLGPHLNTCDFVALSPLHIVRLKRSLWKVRSLAEYNVYHPYYQPELNLQVWRLGQINR